MFWITLSIQIVSILFCLASIRKLYAYIRVYRFKEKDYKLLLGFIHLRQIMAVYVLSTVTLSIVAIVAYLSIRE